MIAVLIRCNLRQSFTHINIHDVYQGRKDASSLKVLHVLLEDMGTSHDADYMKSSLIEQIHIWKQNIHILLI